MYGLNFYNKLRLALTSVVVAKNKGSATDPVQKLFVDKVREYKEKSKDGALVEPSPAIIKELKTELGKLEKHFGGGPGIDMNEFPKFEFNPPKVDPIDDVPPEVKQTKKGPRKAKKKKVSKKAPKKK